jgi:hypothetical protein
VSSLESQNKSLLIENGGVRIKKVKKVAKCNSGISKCNPYLNEIKNLMAVTNSKIKRVPFSNWSKGRIIKQGHVKNTGMSVQHT